MKTMSKDDWAEVASSVCAWSCTNCNASVPRVWRTLLRWAMTSRRLSTATTLSAPLDSASNDSTPLPANKSRHTAPASRNCSQLNRVSRIRSEVGLNPCRSKTGIFLPFQRPPMMRTPFWYLATAQNHAQQPVWKNPALENLSDLFQGYGVHPAGESIHIVKRQIVKPNAQYTAGNF